MPQLPYFNPIYTQSTSLGALLHPPPPPPLDGLAYIQHLVEVLKVQDHLYTIVK